MELGARIKSLRKRRGQTLQAIADQCGFTKSLLSKIEHGRSVPPVATLTRIATALGVTTSALLDGEGRTGTIHSTAKTLKKNPLVLTDKGYSFFAFASQRTEKMMQPFLFEVRKGQVKRHKLSHTGEEFLYVLEGRIKYRVGTVAYSLGPGDSLYFDAEQEHEVTPESPRAQYLAVFVSIPESRGLPPRSHREKKPRRRSSTH